LRRRLRVVCRVIDPTLDTGNTRPQYTWRRRSTPAERLFRSSGHAPAPFGAPLTILRARGQCNVGQAAVAIRKTGLRQPGARLTRRWASVARPDNPHDAQGRTGVREPTDTPPPHTAPRTSAPTSRPSAPAVLERVASFGPFRVRVTERLLEKNGNPIKVGSRALDILIALLEHAPEIVSKRDLMRRVWAELIVDEGSLRVHIAALRKALGGGEGGSQRVTNVPERR